MGTKSIFLAAAKLSGLWLLVLVLAGCAPSAPTLPPATPTPLPTLSLDQTSVKPLDMSNFDAIHSQTSNDPNQYLILGNIPVAQPAADLPANLAVFSGRWEGYNYFPPVVKDMKIVLIIKDINEQEGDAFGYEGTNLQFPDRTAEAHFRVVQGDQPRLEFQSVSPDGSSTEVDTITYDPGRDTLVWNAKLLGTDVTAGPFEFTRSKSFFIYKDYAKYLESKRIYTKTYQDSSLQQYGKSYMVYLPEGYETQTEKTWPLIFFLHGIGDRGGNVYVLAKASPFMYIREKGPLPFIIVAPLLSTPLTQEFSSFPDEYMAGVLKEIQASYRVDAKRIYLTGLSMGGEAAYRFAVNQPETFAALVPLSTFVTDDTLAKLGNIKSLPVWAIHGENDITIPLAAGQRPADALKQAGGNIEFTVLKNHDHDTWTDTYSDKAFYDWLMQYQKK